MAPFDFQQIVERLPLVVYMDRLDERSSPIFISSQIEQLLGYTREEWLADPELFSKSLHPDDRDRVLQDVADRNRTGESVRYADYRLLTRDGRVVWIRDDEVVVRDEAGRPIQSQGYLQDVTSRRHDSMRLELLVGILGLAAEERTPEEIVREAARMLACAVGDVNVTFVEVAPGPALLARYSTALNGPILDSLEIPGYLELLERGPIVVEDVRNEAWLASVQQELDAQRVRSAVDVPLRRDGKLVGVLWFNTPGPRQWDAHEVTVLSDVAEQLAAVLGNAEAREEQRRAARDLRSRDAILAAVSRAAEHFLKQPDFEQATVDLMRVLAEATAASRAYVFENLPGEDGTPLCIRRASWAAGENPTHEDPRLGHVQPAPHFPRWAAALAAGEALSGHVRELPEHERVVMELVGGLSVLAVPIFVDDVWWGFIGFEDCERERDWSAAETDALRAAAGLVAAAISRERAERDLRRRDAILEAVSRAAERLVAEPSWRDAAPTLLRDLGLASAADRAYLFETEPAAGKLVLSQRYEWVAPGVAPQIDNPLLRNFAPADNGFADEAAALERNEFFLALPSVMPEGQRRFLEQMGIKSMLTVPVFVDDACWGAIGFEDCRAEREWTAAETDALRTAASILAAAIERERAEAILREHEQKLRAVFETALDAIFITDDDRRYVDVNPAACDYMGVAKRDLIGRRIDEFLPSGKLATVEEDWAEYVAGGPTLAEWETQRPDGTIRVAEASAHPNFLPGLHIAFFRDATDRRRLEAELLHAQKLEGLGRLAGGVAHDFNNLLTGITGYASLLLERANGDAELARDLGEIKRAADRAAELTKQLLAFGRRQVLKPQALDLNAALGEITSLLTHLVGEGVRLDIRPALSLGTVRADPGQFEQIVVNLAVNARDAMPNGGVLTIRTRNAEDGFVELVCTDSGVGMDEATLAQIFDPFFTTREQGVGLGLASVYGIVHQSGGDVRVTSAPGAGTTFTVRLPRVEAPVPTAGTPPAAAPKPGSETILLVEDEDVVRELTRRVLERQGYTVLACADGSAAVDLAGRHDQAIDLLLTDVVMPGLRGHEVARLVSASRPEIKILYMSGYAEEMLVGRDSIPQNALIEKPFAVDALGRRVREALGTG